MLLSADLFNLSAIQLQLYLHLMLTFTPLDLWIEMMTEMDDWKLDDCFYWFAILDFIDFVFDFAVTFIIFDCEKYLYFNGRVPNYVNYQTFHFISAVIPHDDISHFISPLLYFFFIKLLRPLVILIEIFESLKINFIFKFVH